MPIDTPPPTPPHPPTPPLPPPSMGWVGWGGAGVYIGIYRHIYIYIYIYIYPPPSPKVYIICLNHLWMFDIFPVFECPQCLEMFRNVSTWYQICKQIPQYVKIVSNVYKMS